ncbi:MAG TPA: cytochrome c [Anaeromyxobacteraceae bacterium]|nr:cytochrome c [Anaeromyxobacteraceae bacterium]
MRKLVPYLAATVAALFAVAARAGAPPKKTPELIAQGKASYATNCAACHGDAGKGDGPAGAALEPKPRDLVKGAFKKGAAPAQVFDTVTKGIDGTTMIGFGHLPEQERWALTYYTLELRGKK